MSSQPFTAFTDRVREGEPAAPQPGCTAQQPTAVLAQQDHVIRLREHEQSLGALANSVSTLRTMGGEIRSELLLQNSMLDNLDHGVDEVQRTLDAQQGRHEAAYAADQVKATVALPDRVGSCGHPRHPRLEQGRAMKQSNWVIRNSG